mmetsp:Transcript_86446/g.241912  ORF Transcript_86446/g.241912 Transcript_86446/m.241912 type:complete len:333 (-) Transcript_86446:675-1673(-)
MEALFVLALAAHVSLVLDCGGLLGLSMRVVPIGRRVALGTGCWHLSGPLEVIWLVGCDADRHGDVHEHRREGEGANYLASHDVVLHITKLEHDEKKLGAAHHPEANQCRFCPREASRNEFRSPGGGHELTNEEGKEEDNRIAGCRRQDFHINEDNRAELQEEERPEPAVCDDLDVVQHCMVIVACGRVVVLLLHDQTRHVRADGGVKTEQDGDQSPDHADEQRDESGLVSVLVPHDVSHAVGPQARNLGENSFLGIVGENEAVADDNEHEEPRGLAHDETDTKDRRLALARSNRHAYCHEGKGGNIVQHSRRHDADGRFARGKTFGLQRDHR